MSPPTSRKGLRKNGSEASCETCRKRKSKCDHRRPTCSYCARRKLDCFYHPAPMSRLSSRLTPTATVEPPTLSEMPYTFAEQPHIESQPQLQPQPLPLSPPRGPDEATTSNSNGTPASHYETWPFAEAGKKVPSTFVSELHEQRMKSRHLNAIKEVLGCLQHLRRIRAIVEGYIAEAKFSHVPRPIVKLMLELLPAKILPDGVQFNGGLDKLAKEVCVASSSPVHVEADTDWRSFCKLYSGPNLRIETVGLLLSVCAKTVLFGKQATVEPVDAEFISDMLHCTNLSLDTARALSPQTNDVLFWLTSNTTCMLDFLDGDTST